MRHEEIIDSNTHNPGDSYGLRVGVSGLWRAGEHCRGEGRTKPERGRDKRASGIPERVRKTDEQKEIV